MAGLLLDTHVVLWAAATPERLNDPAREALVDPMARLLVSSISAAEIEIKRAIGKLRLDATCAEIVDGIGAEWLDLTSAHVAGLRDLPLLHRDPFDRLLVAQAATEDLVLVSADADVLSYDVTTLRA